jgi:Carboxypeptidase regulatory-like domain
MNQRDQVAVSGRVSTADGARTASLSSPKGSTRWLWAAAPYAPVAVQVAVEDGEPARREVQLPASGRVAGTALSGDDERPFAGAQLSLANEAGAEVATAAADAGGRFVFGDVPSGRYTLVASGYRPGVAALPAGDARTRQADITLARPE